jgi:hypothetical protein
MEYYGHVLKQYYRCWFVKQLEDGRIQVTDEENGDDYYKIGHDHLRLRIAPDALPPSYVGVKAATAGSVLDEEAFQKHTSDIRDILRDALNEAFDIPPPAEYELFGRVITVSSQRAKDEYVQDLAEDAKELCREAYTARYKKHKSILGDNMESVFDNYHSDVGACLDEAVRAICAHLNEKGVFISYAMFANYYKKTIFDDNYVKLVNRYNEIVNKRNEAARKHNNIKDSSPIASGWHKGIYNLNNPDKLFEEQETIDLLLESVDLTVQVFIRSNFRKAVNDYLGETYFAESRAVEVAGQLAQQYEALPSEQWQSEEGLALLLRGLSTDSSHRGVIRDLFVRYHYPGCGLTEFVEKLNPGKSLASQIKSEILRDWFFSAKFDSASNYAECIKLFADHCAQMEITREDAPESFMLMSILRCGYEIYSATENTLLYRFQLGAIYGEPDRREFAKTMNDVLVELRDGPCVASVKVYRDNLLHNAQRLAALIDEDNRTVFGLVFQSFDEAQEVRAGIADFIAYYRKADYDLPDTLMKIDAMIEESPYRAVLLPFKEKARSFIELKARANALLAEISGRVYTNRQGLIYDFMRCLLASYEYSMLWNEYEAFDTLYDNLVNDVYTVFGQSFGAPTDANDYYFDVMEKAWSYQEYLNEKNNPQKGFFSKIGNAVSGLTKKKYEPEYMLASENATKPLPPLLENERANTQSYLDYITSEREKLYVAYCERYDPTAIDGRQRMKEIKKDIGGVSRDTFYWLRSQILKAE